MTPKEILTTKLGLWVDTCLSTGNTIYNKVRGVEKSPFYFKLLKQQKAVMVILHAVC